MGLSSPYAFAQVVPGPADGSVALPSALPVGAVPDGNLVLVMGDPGGRIEIPPASAQLEAGEELARCDLLDDGEAPDARAGDGNYTCALAGYPRGEVLVTLTDGQGQTLWQDRIPIQGLLARPRISALLTETHVRIALETIGEIGNDDEQDEPLQNEAFVDPKADEAHPHNADAPSSPSSAQGSGLWGLLGAAGLGFLAGLATPPVVRRLRRSRGSLVCAAPAAPTPSSATLDRILGQRQVWVLPDASTARESLVALARALAGSRPVLVATQPQDRARVAGALAGVQGVYQLAGQQAEASELLRAAKRLGRGIVLLVQGHAALEQPLEHEEHDIVVQELLADATAQVSVLVLATATEDQVREPTARLERADAGLVDAGGSVLLDPGPAGEALVVPMDVPVEPETPALVDPGTQSAFLPRDAPSVLRWIRPKTNDLRWVGEPGGG